MSQRLKTGLATIGIVIGMITGMAGLVQSWALLPYRVDQNERAVTIIQTDQKIDREILIRIEEQIKAIRSDLTKRNL